MAARIINNSKRTNTGYVEATPHLDIRELKRRGIIAEGLITRWQHPANPDWKIIADLRSEDHPEVLVETPVTLIVVRLVNRPARFGGKRWFFQDEKGRACEILYLRNWWLVSREAAKLSYRSQSEGTVDRLFARLDHINSKLKGNLKAGPARGHKRSALLAEREKIESALERVGAALGGALHETSKNVRERNDRSKERLAEARELIERDQVVNSTEVIARYRGLVAHEKARRERHPAAHATVLPVEIAKRPKAPELDMRLLRRLGYLKVGKLTGHQIAWPEKWLGKRDRQLFLLADLRTEGRFCAILVRQDAEDEPLAQLFWLAECPGPFGKSGFVFEDPQTGRQAQIVRYGRGSFALCLDE